MKVQGNDIICEAEDTKGFEDWLLSHNFIEKFKSATREANDSNHSICRLVIPAAIYFGVPVVFDTKKELPLEKEKIGGRKMITEEQLKEEIDSLSDELESDQDEGRLIIIGAKIAVLWKILRKAEQTLK